MYFGNSPMEKKTVATLRIKQYYVACSTPTITRTVPQVTREDGNFSLVENFGKNVQIQFCSQNKKRLMRPVT